VSGFHRGCVQGTLGGLVATAPRFAHILRSALERLRICSNDPVCADHEPDDRSGDRATHGAACHGCLLIAETSCEMRNLCAWNRTFPFQPVCAHNGHSFGSAGPAKPTFRRRLDLPAHPRYWAHLGPGEVRFDQRAVRCPLICAKPAARTVLASWMGSSVRGANAQSEGYTPS
jgi:hypothetical protein